MMPMGGHQGPYLGFMGHVWPDSWSKTSHEDWRFCGTRGGEPTSSVGHHMHIIVTHRAVPPTRCMRS